MDQMFDSSVVASNNDSSLSTHWYSNNTNGSSDYYYDDQFFNNSTTRPIQIDPYANAEAIVLIIKRFYLGFISVFGVLGNAYNVFTFVRAKRKMSSPSYYLTALALNDVIFLIVVFILWLKHFDLDLDLVNIRGVYQTLFFISSTSSCISVWLVAAFTFERLIVVRYPLKRSIICTVRRAKWIIFSITVVVCIIQAISLYTTGVIYESLQTIPVEDNKRMQTMNETFVANVTKDDDGVILHLSLTDDSINKQQKRHWNRIINEAKHIFNVFEAVFTFAFPPVLIVIMNACIIHGLAQYNQTFNTGANNNQQHRSRGNHQVNIEMKSMRSSIEGITHTLQTNAVSVQPDSSHTRILKDDESHHQSRQINDAAECIAFITKSDSNSSLNQQKQQCFVGSTLATMEQQSSLIIPLLHSAENRLNLTGADDEEIIVIARVETAADDDGIAINNMPNTAKVLDDSQREEVIGNGSASAVVIDIKRVDETHQLNMDAICEEETAFHLSSESNIVLVHTESNCTPVLKTVTQQQHTSASISLNRTASVNLARSNQSNNEYNISKKLVIVSTVHILLNVPSYVLHLKTFIDENITLNTDSSAITELVQDCLMMLYYTSFAINFLLYSTTNSTFRHQLFCCKTNQQPQAVL